MENNKRQSLIAYHNWLLKEFLLSENDEAEFTVDNYLEATNQFPSESKSAEEFLKEKYPILNNLLLEPNMPAGIDEIVCKALEEYASQSHPKELQELIEKYTLKIAA